MAARITRRLILVLLLAGLSALPLIAEENGASGRSQQRSGFISNLFFTGQFGGGPMASVGAGLAFLDNIVRPEILAGYTVGDGFNGFSVTAKLNARVLALPINDWFGIYGTIGTAFVFYSADAQIVSAGFLAQELEFKNVLNTPALSLYFEQDFFFVDTIEGSVLFQLAIGIRASLF
jgi:hypothetical protein